jgi:hypothetical protein
MFRGIAFLFSTAKGTSSETKDLATEQPTNFAKMKKQYEAWFDDVASRCRELSPIAHDVTP